ncbi:MAG: hypothetical protein QM820_11915 [Minicystis sp.]
MRLCAIVIRAKDVKAVGLEETAERLLLDVDVQLAGDERDHLGLRASWMVDEVLGDRTGVLRAKPRLPVPPELAQIASSISCAVSARTVRIARSVRPTAAPTCAALRPMSACRRKYAATRSRTGWAAMTATNRTAASSRTSCDRVAPSNTSACSRCQRTHASCGASLACAVVVSVDMVPSRGKHPMQTPTRSCQAQETDHALRRKS